MRTGGEAFVLVDSAAARIRAATAPWGLLKLGFSEPDHLIGVTGAGERRDSMYDTGRAELTGHVLSRVDHTMQPASGTGPGQSSTNAMPG